MITAKMLKESNDSYIESLIPTAKERQKPSIDSIIELWKNRGEELVKYMYDHHCDYANLDDLGKYSVNEVGISFYDGLSDKEREYFIENLARPFIKSGYDVCYDFPWDDWSGGHSAQFAIGLPGTIKKESIIQLKNN